MTAGVDAESLLRLQLVADAALEHLELEDLLQAVVARTRELLDADTATVLLIDEDDPGSLVARAAAGLEEEVERRVRVPVGAGFAGRVAATQEPVVILDLDLAEVVNPLLRERGLKSLAGVPLLVRDRLVGVLHVGSVVSRQFNADEIVLLQLAASRIAAGLANALLFQREREARRRLEQIQAVTDTALAQLALDALLDQLLTRVRDILGTDTAAVLLLDDRTNDLVARAAKGIEEEVERGVRIPLGRGFAGRIAAERRPILLPDVDHADVLNPILREKRIKTLLGVPLELGDRAIGVIHVGTLTPREFTPRDVELLQLVAERVALAIEKARVYQEIVELDKMRLNFVAVASHELRTPAAAIYGFAATLRERYDQLDAETQAQMREVLYQQSERLRLLIEQLLDLSRLDARAIEIRPRPVTVRALVAEVIDAVAAGRHDDVEVDIDEEYETEADPVVLERILGNVVVNALRHGRPPVRVSARRAGGDLRLTVEDRGDGVPPELVPRLFDRFERGGEGQGSGLGLAIAQSYAKAHGLELVYVDGDTGARFELVLPTYSA
jgi:signal transduction histidine kinase